MDASIKEYFSSPDEMLSRAVNVLKFQNAQQGIIQQNFHQLVYYLFKLDYYPFFI